MCGSIAFLRCSFFIRKRCKGTTRRTPKCIKVYRSVLNCIVTYPNVLKCIVGHPNFQSLSELIRLVLIDSD